jgi:hypothetical protein
MNVSGPALKHNHSLINEQNRIAQNHGESLLRVLPWLIILAIYLLF